MLEKFDMVVALAGDFHAAKEAAQEATDGKEFSALEYVEATRIPGGEEFTLIHEPDGPWLAIRPLDDAAFRVMGADAAEWAERQRWDVIFVLRGTRVDDGSWKLDFADIAEAL